jgi:hypothetical protein
MALQRLDPGGYEVSSSTTILLNAGFNNDNSFVGVSNSVPAGRSNPNGYTTSLSGSFVGWWFSSNFAESILGFAYYNPNTTFTNNARICNFQDGATTQIDVRTDGSGHLFFTRNGTAIGSASSNALTTGWHYIEVKAKIASGVLGSCEIRVDNTVWLTVTGVNTQATGNAYANRYYIISRAAATQYWNDIYVLDTGTGINATYLSDITIKALHPASADGTYQQWTANTGTQLAAVQDQPPSGTWPNGDTAYISDTVSGDISAFGVDSLGGNATIFGVVHVTYARTASSGTINQVLVNGGSVVETSATCTLTTSYLYYQDVQEQDPNTSATWSSSGVNATHPGVKIQATSASARVSQELMLVAYSNLTAPPEEDFWRNAVRPVVASTQGWSSLGDREEIPAGTLFRTAHRSTFWIIT